jgi:hypothetical protein
VTFLDLIIIGSRYVSQISKECCSHGLSYTTFTLSNLEVSSSGATVVVHNTGLREGAEVVQLYMSPVQPTTCRPVKELKAFGKVFLAAGEAKALSLNLDRNATSYWSETREAWVSEKGEYHVFVGVSSDRIILTGRFVREKTEIWTGI